MQMSSPLVSGYMEVYSPDNMQGNRRDEVEQENANLE